MSTLFCPLKTSAPILIESQWNLNSGPTTTSLLLVMYINRITVEFKLYELAKVVESNRILIESQWNLNHSQVSGSLPSLQY